MHNHLLWAAYRVAKDGHAAAECEDACAADPATGRFAIADGASESAFAGAWAEALAQGYVAHPGPWSAWLAAARAAWHDRFADQPMPWYVEAKFEQGAFATLLGLSVRGRSWRAGAVGDSCLFHVRDNGLGRAFPIKRSTDFNNAPALIASRSGAPRCKRRWTRGRWQPGETLLLMTDALAQWFLQEVEAGRQPWAPLMGIESLETFAAVVGELRATDRLRNDDSTLAWARYG
jgi:hypothetical protein